jgi:hypothetical protein
MSTVPSQIIPSGRARRHRARSTGIANRATGVALLGLAVLALLGTPIAVLALVALMGLGSILILTDESIEKTPHTPVF